MPNRFSFFADLGSAVLNAELAYDMLEPEQQTRYHLIDAPLVEGAFAAAITAGFSDDLSQITAEAQKQLRKDGINNEKIINDPSAIVEEMLAGLVDSYPQLVHQVEDSRVVAKTPPTNKLA